MTTTSQPPWASGPGEILRHGLALLKKDSDSNRRLAMISIDNAVELMIKTFLGLPKRITGLSITRKELIEAGESFPSLLDALERHATDKLDGIDLGTIEWYHRLRNELYHQGNGLTVERDKVEAYAVLANQLFRNLFNVVLLEHVTPSADMLGEFIQTWTTIERGLSSLVTRERIRLGHDKLSITQPQQPRTALDAVRYLTETSLLSKTQVMEIDYLRQLRNEILHGHSDYRNSLTPTILARAQEMAERLSAFAQTGEPFPEALPNS